MADFLRRLFPFTAAHLVIGACCFLLAYGGTARADGNAEQPRFSTHSNGPAGPPPQGRYHAGTCPDGTAWVWFVAPDHVPGADDVVPADIDRDGAVHDPYLFAFDLAGPQLPQGQHWAIDPADSVVIDTDDGLLAHNGDPLYHPLPAGRLGGCLDADGTFIDK
jgi:hypothetical protein